jgi:hypothetical protein
MAHFSIFDADNHYYETTDAFTRFLPKQYDGLFKFVEVNGRTKLAIKNVISEYIPNPTFNVVAPPGLFEIAYRLKNPDSKTAPGEKLELPPRYEKSIPAYFEPEPRAKLMDELGVDRTLLWPTLATLIEERLADDPVATHDVVHAFNRWLHDQWSFNFQDRIFAAPLITLPIVDKAIEEFEWALEHGAKVILVRPAPVPDFNGRRRSFALPEFDAFWARVERRVPALRGSLGLHEAGERRISAHRGRAQLDRGSRSAHTISETSDAPDRDRICVGAPPAREVQEGLWPLGGSVRRGSHGSVRALHLDPPVP